MSRIVVAGAGAFGTALALTQLRAGRDVTLVGRNVTDLISTRFNPRLPDIELPETLNITNTLDVTRDDILLLCIPMQQLTGYLTEHNIKAKSAIACCKGIDLATGRGPTDILRDYVDAPATGILTGPSFAIDIARGLPTALTLAMQNGQDIQTSLATDTLRLYLSNDPTGAELGGALKNVIAIACGLCIGAGLGESARAALMTRGYAEMQRMALALGAKEETLSGLSGFGDLTLTCTSAKSRNFSFGLALGSGKQAPDATTEGRSTALAVVALAQKHAVEMPIAKAVAGVVENKLTLTQALEDLLSRPLTKE